MPPASATCTTEPILGLGSGDIKWMINALDTPACSVVTYAYFIPSLLSRILHCLLVSRLDSSQQWHPRRLRAPFNTVRQFWALCCHQGDEGSPDRLFDRHFGQSSPSNPSQAVQIPVLVLRAEIHDFLDL